MGKKNDIQPGQTYGDWTVIQCCGADKPGTPIRWLCRCSCGKESRVVSNTLRNGKSTGCASCGRKKWACSSFTHGASSMGKRTGSYQTWIGMHARCYNPNEPSYAHYGARGISVCDKWKTFEGFLEDMGERPDGMSIDRIDVNGNYCKENCRWADRTTQARNTTTTVYISYNGESMPLAAAIEKSGIARATYGWYLWKKKLDQQSAFDAALLVKRNKLRG